MHLPQLLPPAPTFVPCTPPFRSRRCRRSAGGRRPPVSARRPHGCRWPPPAVPERRGGGMDRRQLLRAPRRSGPARDDVLVHEDRKSTRLNSSHLVISYAVFCLKK